MITRKIKPHRSRQRRPPPQGVRPLPGTSRQPRFGFKSDLVRDLLCDKPARLLTDDEKRQVIDRFVAPLWDRLVGRLGANATPQRLEWATTHVADALWKQCRTVIALGSAKQLALWAYQRGIVR